MPRFSPMPDTLAVVRLPPDAPIPTWAIEPSAFASVTRTSGELSIVCPEARVPPGITAERGWRALQIHGPLQFDAVGILAGFASPLADAGISIFAVSTFDTDYVLVKAAQVDRAVEALVAAGHACGDA